LEQDAKAKTSTSKMVLFNDIRDAKIRILKQLPKLGQADYIEG
jgi:hypothetical protein